MHLSASSLVLLWVADSVIVLNGSMIQLSVHKKEATATLITNATQKLGLALLRAEAAQVFCDSTMRAIVDVFPQISYCNLAGGLLTENVSADAISPAHKATLQSLLCRLLRRMLTPWHIAMPDVKYDNWFRTKVLPIVADEDGHVVAATSTVSLALACPQPLAQAVSVQAVLQFIIALWVCRCLLISFDCV